MELRVAKESPFGRGEYPGGVMGVVHVIITYPPLAISDRYDGALHVVLLGALKGRDGYPAILEGWGSFADGRRLCSR